MRRTAIATALFLLATAGAGHAGPSHLKCMGRWVTITGTPGKDELHGTGKRDVISGLGGNDTIDLGHDDVACGGHGDDMITGSDWVYPYAKADVVRGGKGPDHLFGNFGSDLMIGDRGADEVRGWNGADVVRGGPGRDQLHGDGDIEFYAHGDDFIRGGRGIDTIGWTQRGVQVDKAAGRAVGEGIDRFVGIEIVKRRLF